MPDKADNEENPVHDKLQDADANVDKIRDILFGGHIRDYDQRFATLEQRLADSIAQTSRDIEKRLENLDALTRSEFEKLAQQLNAESADRVSGDEQSAAESKRLTTQVEGWFAEVEDKLATEAKDIRATLKQQGGELSGLLRTLETQLKEELSRETSALAASTVPRSDLAALLTEVATRLEKQGK